MFSNLGTRDYITFQYYRVCENGSDDLHDVSVNADTAGFKF